MAIYVTWLPPQARRAEREMKRLQAFIEAEKVYVDTHTGRTFRLQNGAQINVPTKMVPKKIRDHAAGMRVNQLIMSVKLHGQKNGKGPIVFLGEWPPEILQKVSRPGDYLDDAGAKYLVTTIERVFDAPVAEFGHQPRRPGQPALPATSS